MAYRAFTATVAQFLVMSRQFHKSKKKAKNSMKKVLIPLCAVAIFSCQKKDTPATETEIMQIERKIEICTVDSNAILADLLSSRKPIKWFNQPTTPTPPPPTPTPTPTPVPTTTSYNACIYLDFDGEIVNSPYWNNGQTITCLTSGLGPDGIAAVVAKVKANYSLFNVEVTDQLSVYNAAPVNKRQHVIITPTSYWQAGAGGISYIGSILFGDGTPSFVFSDRMYYDANYIGETASHEAGHGVGLFHQSVWTSSCTLGTAYAPNVIMGNSLLGNSGNWTYGTSSQGCNIYQDDQSVLGSTLGLR